jgi:multicomponent Na+:H+ antiporter subunit D
VFLPSLRIQRIVSLASTLGALAASILLLVEVEADGIAALDAGGWPAPYGITLVADLAASMFLVVSLAVIVLVQIFAIGQGADRSRPRIAHPVYLVLASGVSLSFLTGDLFNLFVAFEVMLISSYVLLTLGAGREQIRAGMTYVVINVLSSTMLLTAVSLVYAATGTVNMADLVEKFAALPEATQTMLGLFLLAVFATKAAIFPFFFWLPDSYPTGPTAVTALFAGLLTKIGVYALIRTQTLFFTGDWPSGLILFLAGATMIVGVLGAIAQNDVKRILSFHIVSQIGYMVMGLGLFTIAGLAGAIFFIVHQIVVKTSLFLTGGLIEHAGGSGRLSRVGELLRRAPLVAALFLISALSLAGIPPLSGFVGKFALVTAGTASEEYLLVGVSLFASLLTLFSMMKIWAGAFWAPATEVPDGTPHEVGRLGGPFLMVAPTVVLTVITLAIAIAAGPLYRFSERAATELLDPTQYISAVLG